MYFLLRTLVLFSISVILQSAIAEPVQYCRFGNADNSNERVDFCMGTVLHKNLSTASHDLLLSLTHTRHGGSRLGWTAVGLGDVMKGSLMFIIYGDPRSGQAPLLSIRGALGHHQPKLLTRADVGGADLRLVDAAWDRLPKTIESTDKDDYVAKINLICYSCARWPGTLISTTTKSQPWIWAWNPDQDFPVYSFDAPLEMHAHHSTSGGFGNFYVDMARAINDGSGTISLPPIRPGIAMLGTSDTPAGFWKAFVTILPNPRWHVHAVLMGVVFFVLFPGGVLAMRSGADKAFRYHWAFQLSGSVLMICGMSLGIIMRRNINTFHQSVGIGIAAAIGIQCLLGWRHHVAFFKTSQRTWVSDAHVLLGRSVILVGWGNVVIGMKLYGHSLAPMVIVILVVLVLMIGSIWVWRSQSRMKATQNIGDESQQGTQHETKYRALERDSIEI